ncbi:MAG: hypothetical protein WAO13_17450 [Pseudolabrys sp.]
MRRREFITLFGGGVQAFEDYRLARAIFHSPVGARPIRRPSTPKVN